MLFGGAVFVDTWEWDGATWTQAQPAQSPPARINGAFAFDPGRGTLILAAYHPGRQTLVIYGGTRANGVYINDVWEWDGASWTSLATTSQTSGSRNNTLLAFDASHHL